MKRILGWSIPTAGALWIVYAMGYFTPSKTEPNSIHPIDRVVTFEKTGVRTQYKARRTKPLPADGSFDYSEGFESTNVWHTYSEEGTNPPGWRVFRIEAAPGQLPDRFKARVVGSVTIQLVEVLK